MRARRDAHYKRVSKKRQQSSVKRFRERCRFFPHPIDLFGPAGVVISRDVNYAATWSDLNFLQWLMPVLEKHLPSTEGLLHTWHFDATEARGVQWFLRNVRRDGGPGVVAGVVFLDAHAVFYEARCDARYTTGVVHILDPNGSISAPNRERLVVVFAGMEMREVAVPSTNFGDRATLPPSSKFHQETRTARIRTRYAFRTLGVSDDQARLDGYCAVLSVYFFIEYVCVEEYRRPAYRSEHFFRAASELLSPVNFSGMTSTTISYFRAALLARYVAYHVVRMLRTDASARPTLNYVYGPSDSRRRLTVWETSVAEDEHLGVSATYESLDGSGGRRRARMKDVLVPIATSCVQVPGTGRRLDF